jgi:hypothetical protein
MSVISRRQAKPALSWWHSLIFVSAVILLAVTILIRPQASRGPSQEITYRVVDASSGSPLEGVSVTVGGQTLLTGANGEVRMPVAGVDQDLMVRLNGYDPIGGTAGPNSPPRQQIALALAPTATPTVVDPTATTAPTATNTPMALAAGEPFAGTVVDADGVAIPGAMIRIGHKWILTNDDGHFRFKDYGDADFAHVSASGYADQRVPLTADPVITLDRFMVKGIYLNGTAAGYPDVVDHVIGMIDRTELNAVVLDIKDGVIYYDSDVEFFKKANAVRPTYDAAQLLEKFHEHGIYVIARQVAFKDPLVAAAYPDLAVKEEKSDKLWTGWAGEPWVNPLKKGLYQPNVDLAVEAAELGFDEIQYDYIRFPDGDLKGADFGKNYTDINKRIGALTTILTMTHDALRPLGVKLSADVFGWMLLVDDDQGIGQRFPDIAAVVDYISPMVYPSHFPTGSLALDGPPNDYPYETIQISIGLGMDKIPGWELRMRPWLQDFTLPGQKEYAATDIRDEIDAAEAMGSSGWLIWNVDANYIEDAYYPAGG